MEKYIEEVIEIVLDNVSCEHQIEEEYSGAPAFDNVVYSLNSEKEVIKKCLAAIPAYPMKFILKVDDKFIEEKSLEFFACLPLDPEKVMGYLNDFMQLFLKEISEKINLKGD